jgi:hypothetical protein
VPAGAAGGVSPGAAGRVPRPARIALVVAVVVLLCTVGVCGVAVALGPRLAGLAGCRSDAAPEVSGVQQDAGRIHAALPALGEVTAPHWRWREARPHTCPELGPMDLYYEGFAVLAPDRVAALRAEHEWAPAAAPEVPEELVPFGPRDPAPAWQRSASFDALTRASVWLDPGTGTVYFSYLRG